VNKNTSEISTKLRGFDFKFKTTYGLFSYQKIDEGSRLLVENLKVGQGKVNYLDLGCGYGVIGIVMAKLNPNSKTYLVDRDFVAIEHAKTNCQINKIKNGFPLLSDGFSHLPKIKFDLVAANLPTHLAKSALEKIIFDAAEQLNRKGQIYLVCVSKLQPYFQKQLKKYFGNFKKINSNKNHTLFLAQKL